MLADANVAATIAVKNLATAQKFYEDVLGFKRPAADQEGAVLYDSGSSKLLVYESSYAGTNQATAATWEVGSELENVVRELKSKGVTFEHYDNFEYMTRDGDVHKAGDLRIAWLKDPDGNILALTS
jgi:catechol 2,3-dioxygenase-like lactoylglutathione lyase family enzyme